ncbi:MAG TPA: DUF1254 domain-containing protein, partial [Thermomicrobiales bacterium]|nr:DUF1254 domain-containing protein [Thermomicrobiales bacterium]
MEQRRFGNEEVGDRDAVPQPVVVREVALEPKRASEDVDGRRYALEAVVEPLPQSIAYAQIAGLPPQAGVFGSFAAPPGSLCVVADFWFRYVADMGIPGPDRGQGGKYLYLPDGYEGKVPEGYFTYCSPTYTNWVVLRALGGVPDMKKTRIYPLAEADAPPANEWVDMAASTFNSIHANDFSFYEEIDELVQEEPVEAIDPERAGQIAAIGIVKGQPFAPDDRMRGILEQAARIGAGISRALAYTPRDPEASFYGTWKSIFVGGSYEFMRDGARLLD